MATNPRVPEQFEPKRKGPVLVQRAEEPTSSTPGVILAIVTAVLLLGAILYFMPRGKNTSALTTTQPAGSLLAEGGWRMTEAPTGGAISLDGQITNVGSTPVSDVTARVVFGLTNGLRASIARPVQGIATGGKTITGDTEELTKSPIKPNETRPVRIAVEELPKAWNHQTPQVKLTTQ